MTSRITRSTLALIQVSMLGFLLHTSPSGSTAAPDIEPIEASDIALLEELTEWLDEPPTGQGLRAGIRDRSTSFEVFRSFHQPDVRYQRLTELPFGSSLRRIADQHGVDAYLLAAVMEAESSFDPQATSHRGAVGLMQVLPSTAGESPERLYDPELNLKHGARYLKYLLERYGGDLELALAAYNAGPGNVRRYDGVPPFPETRRYVDRVLDLYVTHHREVWQASDTAELLMES